MKDYLLKTTRILCTISVVFFAMMTPALAKTQSTVTITPSTITWSSLTYSDTHDPADGTMTVTTRMQTGPKTGSGSIVIESPSSVIGSNGATLPVSAIHVTCSGATVAGQTFIANDTPLVPNGSVTCATYGTPYNHTSKITITFTINDTVVYADTYVSGTIFDIVATAI